MGKNIIVIAFLILQVACFAGTAHAITPNYTDYWDISQGAVVGSNSTILNHDGSNYSYAANMFGGTSGAPEPANTLFEDYNLCGTSTPYHWIQWAKAPSSDSTTINSFNLFANSTTSGDRGFSEFRLYSRAGTSGAWTMQYQLTESSPIGVLEYSGNITPTTDSYWRAEFDWYSHTAWNSGPRILELDANGYVVPEPASMMLLGLGIFGMAGLRRKKMKG